jgi:hypothetical protein
VAEFFMRGRIGGMDESEAVAKAREVMLAKTGVDAAPDSIEFTSVGGRRRWTAQYQGHIFVVNDKSGEVSAFESQPNTPPWKRSRGVA